MAVLMLLLLGGFLSIQHLRADLMPRAGFDLQKVKGKWYLHGVASNSEWYKHLDVLKNMLEMDIFEHKDNVEMHFRKNGCYKEIVLALKTKTPGQFLIEDFVGLNDARMVQVKYDEFAFVHSIVTRDGASYNLETLYTRSPDVRKDLVEKFKKFSMEQGVQAKNIVILPKIAQCA